MNKLNKQLIKTFLAINPKLTVGETAYRINLFKQYKREKANDVRATH